MKQEIKAAGVLLLLGMLAFSASPQSGIMTASAVLNGSVIYGIPAQMDATEAQATIDGCASIRYYFFLTGRYAYLENYCGANTQNYYVYSVANYLETYPYDFATAFYKGHSTYLPPNSRLNPCVHNHTVLYDNDGGADTDLIWDKEIGLRTVNHRHDFVFLWSCGTANEAQIGGINGTHTWEMAASWLKRTNLNLTGYTTPDGSRHCFIGWQYASKPFSQSTGYLSYTYQIFASMFYYYATYGGYTINGALDRASRNYLGCPFVNSTIYQGWWEYFPEQNVTLLCKIRVWGDGSMSLP
ncbi:MAG: hypothetical protein ACPLIG_03610 [Candidatus Bathyarchaeales archaeon]